MAVSETGTGVIIWFDLKGSYGFLRPDDGSRDIFARLSVKQTMVLEAGERVSYDLLTSGRPAKTEAVITAKLI
jgi:cold shock CspA family protein